MRTQELTVVWYDRNKGQGILIDDSRNEYYIDSSVPVASMLKRHDLVQCVTDRLMPDNLLVVKDIKAIYHGYSRVLR